MNLATGRRGYVTAGFIALALVLAVLALALGRRAPSEGSPLTGRPAPALVGTTLSGEPFLWHPQGKVTVVNIWASWCASCRQELPALQRMAREWSSRGVQVVTVDARDGPAAARSVLREVRATDLVTMRDPHGEAAVAWGVTGVPETVVVDRHGIIRARWLGALHKDWLTGQLRRWTGAAHT